MDLIALFAAIVMTRGMKFAKEGKFYKDYASIERSLPVKGLCVLLVILCHFVGYIPKETTVWTMIHGALGQLVVAMFLFYSGYGLYLASRAKGKEYVRKLPQKAFAILLHFDLAILLYLIFRVVTGRQTELSRFLLSLVGWDSIGNSNWYIFCIVILYIIAYISMRFIKNKYVQASIVTVLSCLFIVAMQALGRPSYYYNTVLCFTCGVWWGVFNRPIDKIAMKNSVIYSLLLAGASATFFLLWKNRFLSDWYYLLSGVLFCVLINLLAMKIQIGNNLLRFLGNHVFSIYILQRLVFSVLAESRWVKGHIYVFFMLSLVGTIFVALLFERATKAIDSVVFRSSKSSKSIARSKTHK